jgi:O-acetyl-ADP-ribose deacetylase (regulator of RNase III)
MLFRCAQQQSKNTMIRRSVIQATRTSSRCYSQRSYIPNEGSRTTSNQQSSRRQTFGHEAHLRNRFLTRALIGGSIVSIAAYFGYQYYTENIRKLDKNYYKSLDATTSATSSAGGGITQDNVRTQTLRSEVVVCRTRVYELEVCRGDITEETTDAIVNAANTRLRHGGGLARAIVVKGGEQVQKDSDKWIAEHGELKVGQVVVTEAHGNLKCKYIIHTAGPIWKGGEENEAKLLAEAIHNVLETADRIGAGSVSIPAVSSGIYKFPKEKCAQIIFTSIFSYFNSRDLYVAEARRRKFALNKVRLVNFDEPTVDVFLQEWDNLKKQGKVF